MRQMDKCQEHKDTPFVIVAGWRCESDCGIVLSHNLQLICGKVEEIQAMPVLVRSGCLRRRGHKIVCYYCGSPALLNLEPAERYAPG